MTMFGCICFRRFVCRKLLTLVLFSYILMIYLFLVTTDPHTPSEESFSLIFPESTFQAKREGFIFNKTYPSSRFAIQTSVRVEFRTMKPRKIRVKFLDPEPLSEPLIDLGVHKENAGDFVPLGTDSFVYSAFLDDRKEQRYVRIMTLMSQKIEGLFIYCHFNDTSTAQPRKSERYELCENHNKLFGGYIYSCLVPDAFLAKSVRAVVISLTKYGPRVKMPLLSVNAPKHRTVFLDAYPRSPIYSAATNQINPKSKAVPLSKHAPTTTPKIPIPLPLSFAICVSPLFGTISVHRLVEFIELSRLLGAEHLFFYNYNLPKHISAVLEYYVRKDVISVLPWTFPAQVGAEIWYHGQLLANNDCLYRAMPYFDLVSFNDMDEFIVPHTNASTWREAFSSLLTEDRCGFSFQSAFYDPGTRESMDDTLLTPILTAKSQLFSRVRTKVMVCPWRVFEVGIHHISKQNREDWRSWGIDPSIAYLHHYRRCIANFGMQCGVWEKDNIIAERYLANLTRNFFATLQDMERQGLPKQEPVFTSYNKAL